MLQYEYKNIEVNGMDENKGKKIMDQQAGAGQTTSSKRNSTTLRNKLLKLMIIIITGLLVIVLIVMIMNAFKSNNLSYEQLENEMVDAAKEYYKVQDALLPAEEGQTVEVTADVLSEAGYMDSLSELKKDATCSGRVEVRRTNDQYVYTPFLDCGSDYTTKELYQALLDQGTVTGGEGLYEMNGNLVFRGEDVNNYLQLDNNLFRIVKADANHNIMIIWESERGGTSYLFDNRYNSDRGNTSGINDYRVSRMRDTLDAIYNETAEEALLSANDKEKLVSFSLCIGKRDLASNDKSNQVECSDVLENQMIGLLTVSDYLTASIDSNCNATTDRACQNYNYLVAGYNWWTMDAFSGNTYQVLTVNGNGYIDLSTASNTRKVRPVLMLDASVMLKSGSGTATDPYILK